MFPDNELSSSAVVRAFADPAREPDDFLLDYERGGLNLNDATEGLSNKIWTLRGVRNAATGLIDLRVSAEGSPTTTLLSGADITEASLAFDQNMNPFLTYVQAGQAKFWWFDSVVGAMVTTNLPAGSSSPRCCFDERRPQNVSNSDIVLSYIRAGGLYFRLQRERYLPERLLLGGLGPDARLIDVGMNAGLRLQWRLRGETTDPAAATNPDPYLADVVSNLARRAGIPPAAIDVSELYDNIVYGYRVANTEGVDEAIKPLSEAYRFDPVEFDKKLRFHKRGRTPALRVKWTDLVANDPPMKRTRVQEDLLPVRVNVNHLDPAGGYAKNKQGAQRRSNQVRTKREDKYDFDFALPADAAATIAMRELKRPYYEQMMYEFELPLKFTHLTCSDVIEFEDKDGTVELIRLEEIEREDGTLMVKGRREGGVPVYGVTAAGQSLPTPRPTTPGLVGETRLEVLNLPVFRDQNDELGLAIAMSGSSTGWYGAQLLVSTDNGVTYSEAYRSDVPSVIGDTLTELKDEPLGYAYPSDQTVDVTVRFPLDSVTYDQLLQRKNFCVIGDELLQFQTATLLTLVGGVYTYRLSGLVRGRLYTATDTWPVGSRFVLIDSTVAFLQVGRAFLGSELWYKPVSFGLTEDETVATSYDFLEGVSQKEFPVSNVTHVRHGTHHVTVSWIGAARLGFDSAPYHSKYFRGYRVKFGDGHTIDTYTQTVDYTSAPVGTTVQVCALNEITGEGPLSPPITL